MAKHTPGPWIIATSCSWRRVMSVSGQHVCTPCIQPSDNHPDLCFPNGGADGPDARLIAASPDLLRALEYMVAAVTSGNVMASDLMTAKEAIAKATS